MLSVSYNKVSEPDNYSYLENLNRSSIVLKLIHYETISFFWFSNYVQHIKIIWKTTGITVIA